MFFLSFAAYGADSLSGLATVELAGNGQHRRYDMAVLISDPSHAVFEVLDDLGNTVLKMETNEKRTWLIQRGKRRRISDKKFKKLLSLPVTPAELVSDLLERAPRGIFTYYYTHYLKISWQKIYQ